MYENMSWIGHKVNIHSESPYSRLTKKEIEELDTFLDELELSRLEEEQYFESVEDLLEEDENER